MPRRVPAVLLVSALVFACALPAFAARTKRRVCKQACDASIQQCVSGGGKLRKCKRLVIRQCRRKGVAVCNSSGIFNIAPTGVDGAACTPEAPCQTIQYVVDLVVPGGTGTIKAAVGTYDALADCFGGVPNRAMACIYNKQIVLRGGFVPPDWDTPMNDPSATVIDGKGEGRGLRIARGGADQPAATLEVDNLTIQNGFARGMTTGDLANLSVGGGGLLVESSMVTVRNVVFRNNRVVGGTTSQRVGGRASGGALSIYNVLAELDPSATLENITFEGNRAEAGNGEDVGGYALGGAMWTYAMAVTGNGLIFKDNTAVAGNTNGPGTNDGHKSDALGGGFAVGSDGVADLRNVQASGNVAQGGDAPNGEGGGAFGGGFFAELGALTISDSLVENNRAQGGAGKNTTDSGSIGQGGGVYATGSGLMVDRVVVRGNEARGGDGVQKAGIAEGGGLAVTLGVKAGVDTPFTVRNSVVVNNLVSLGSGTLVGGGGGGVFVQGAQGTLEYVTIADNGLADAELVGPGIATFAVGGWTTSIAVVDSIVANHATPQPCHADAALWVASTTTADATRVLFANNVHDTNVNVTGCNVTPGVVNETGIVTAPDAGFVSPGSPDHDYHLTALSPAVDQAANLAVTVDLTGTPRPYGPLPDLGACEYTP